MGAIHQNNLSLSKIQGRIQNASFAGTSGATGEGDRGAFQGIPLHTGNPYDQNSYIERYRQLYKLYETSWEARKIVRIPVEDALRKPWEIQGIPEEMADILRRTCDDMKFINVLSRSLMLERLLGGCLTFMGLDAEKDDPAKKFSPRLGQSRLRFLNVVPVSRISRVNWETNPLEYEFMRPNEYMINGQNVHISRCLIWDGDPLIDPHDYAIANYQTNFTGFGQSKLIPIWDDIVKAIGTRQAAFQMIQTNNAIIMAISELQDLSGTNPGKATLAKLKEIANSLSVYRAAIIQKDKVDITQQPASFGSVPELIMSFLQVISAASDIPATRFIGQAPGGLNATGVSDLENYYNMEDAYQRQRITPNILKLYDVIGYQKWPGLWQKERLKLEIVWPPLWNIKELEEAQKNQIELDNMFKAWEAGLMSDEKAIEELNIKKIFSVDLDEKDIDVQKSAEDNAEFYREGDPGTGSPDPQAPKPKQFQVPKHIGTEPKTKMDDVSEHGPKAKMPETLENKDPWEMTKDEWVKEQGKLVSGQSAGKTMKMAKLFHREFVRAWLKEGKPVPDSIISLYPELIKDKVQNKNFEEGDHPRADDGKFGSGSAEKDEDKNNNFSDLGKKKIKWGKTAKENVEIAKKLLSDIGIKAMTENPSGNKTDKRYAAIGSSTNGILINKNSPFWKDPELSAKENYKSGQLSTDNPVGVLLHEIAHIKYPDAPGYWPFPNQKEAASKVSKYATKNPKEFVSEVFAGINSGKEYSEPIMDLYRNWTKKDAQIQNAVDDPVIYDPEQVMIGMKVEMEHNDLTLGDPVEIARIVRAHLQEDPEYYKKLEDAGL